MRINEANIFLFIATIIIGILIAMNLNLSDNMKFLDVVQYQKAYEERTKLQNQISDLEEEYNSLKKRIADYDRISIDIYKLVEKMEEELEYNKMLLGMEPVRGDGIKITIDDSPEVKVGGNYNNSMIIHNTDITKVINDLRVAGAEAIAVNGERVVFDSSTMCAGATVKMNGILKINPFYITAIGDQEVMESYLENQDNHIKTLISRKCTVNVELVYDELLPAYNGTLDSKYLEENKK